MLYALPHSFPQQESGCYAEVESFLPYKLLVPHKKPAYGTTLPDR